MSSNNPKITPNQPKLAEETLMDEEFSCKIFEQSSLGIALIDVLTGHIYEANSGYANVMGRTKNELLSLDWKAITYLDDVPIIQKKLLSLNTGKIEQFNLDTRYLHSDGSYVWVNISIHLLDIQGKASTYLVIAKNISHCKQTESEFKIQQKRLSAIVNNMLDVIIHVNHEGIIQNWNTQAEQIFAWHKDDVIGQPFYDIIIPSRNRQKYIKRMARFLSTDKTTTLNSRIETFALHRDEYEFPIELSIIAVKIEEHYEFHIAIRNITDRKQTEKALLERERYYRLLVESSPYGIHEIDLKGHFLSVNAAELKMLQLDNEEQVLGHSYLDNISTQDRGFIELSLKKAVNGISSHFEFTTLGKKPHYFKSCFIPMKDDADNISTIMGITEDITAQKESEALIWQQANFDSLTGLPNRYMFYERLKEEIKKTARDNQELALLVIDVDRFKDINDALGHSSGDLLLSNIAQRLKSCVREIDTVARLAGDEFAFILSKLDDQSSIERIAEKTLKQFAEPFQISSQAIYVSVSIGITVYPSDGNEVEELLKNAEQAMYAAKEDGRGRYHYFTPFMQKAAQIRMQIANDLRVALDDGQFQLYYQPIVNWKTGLITKAEALIRWNHPEHGLISPAAFIPIAEETRMIVEIGNWVFHEAARQVCGWRKKYCADFQISVNKSPVQFYSEDNAHLIWLDYLKKLNLSGDSIVVEITEGLLLDINSTVAEQLLNFHEAGIQVSLDDFGTGYSSLSYLKKFDIDFLKIDQSFVRNLETDPNDMVLCEAIIVMAHKLGIKVIAEGIETSGQSALLSEAGCDYAQGYLFSKPIIGEQFEDLLKTQKFKIPTAA